MLYPHPDPGRRAERCRSFKVAQFSGYLNSKPWGAWGLGENADGCHQWKPINGRIGPKMLAIRDAVSIRPGCSREEAVPAVGGYLTDSGRYGPLGRALDVGLVIADWPDRDHVRLFASGAARRIWYLRRELLEPGLPSRPKLP